MAQHIRILIVEDSPHDAELVERELRRGNLDFSIKRVERENDLRAVLESTDPDVILCDYNLPGFSGVEALNIAREQVPDTPFIFVSGSIGEERAVQTLREGAVDYILKDRLSRLPSAITRALDQRRDRVLRRRAQEALQRSEERFQYAAKATQEVIWDWDLVSGKVWFNNALVSAWGYPADNDHVTADWRESRIHPDDRPRVTASLRAAMIRDERWSDEYRFQRADGRYAEVLDHSVIVRNGPGDAIRVITAMLDISDRVAAEQTIRRLSHQNELVLNSAAEGIVSVDRNGKAILVNPAAAKMTGFSVEEFLAAENVHDLIHYAYPDGQLYPRKECLMMKSVRDGTSHAAQDTFWRKSGDSFSVEFSSSPMHEGSEIAGSVIIFQDITERKRLERQIEQAQRVASLGRVAATIAHEFNNVLMGIQPFAEVIRRNTEEEKLQKAASQIVGSVARGRRVTQEILRFTQPGEPALQPVQLQEWVQQLVPELQALVDHRIHIEIDAPPEPIFVRCDSAQMQQVVTNLVVNARDAMPNGGTITIRVAPSGSFVPSGMALLSVRDSGTGMMPEILQNIFEPLFTTKRTGTGLGLTVAQQIVSRHGGSIHAESTPGEGSVFEILLPAASGAAPPQLRSERRVEQLRSVLLVEDDATIVAGITLLMQSQGIRVQAVDLGAKAIEAIATSQPDAVILDISLPDMSGIGVYEQIAKRWPRLPVVFSTGHGDEGTLDAHASRPRNVAFLRKPYDMEALLEALERITIGESEGTTA